MDLRILSSCLSFLKFFPSLLYSFSPFLLCSTKKLGIFSKHLHNKEVGGEGWEL